MGQIFSAALPRKKQLGYFIGTYGTSLYVADSGYNTARKIVMVTRMDAENALTFHDQLISFGG